MCIKKWRPNFALVRVLFNFVAENRREDLVNSRTFVDSGHRVLSESMSEAERNDGIHILIGNNFGTTA